MQRWFISNSSHTRTTISGLCGVTFWCIQFNIKLTWEHKGIDLGVVSERTFALFPSLDLEYWVEQDRYERRQALPSLAFHRNLVSRYAWFVDLAFWKSFFLMISITRFALMTVKEQWICSFNDERWLFLSAFKIRLFNCEKKWLYFEIMYFFRAPYFHVQVTADVTQMVHNFFINLLLNFPGNIFLFPKNIWICLLSSRHSFIYSFSSYTVLSLLWQLFLCATYRQVGADQKLYIFQEWLLSSRVLVLLYELQ